MRHLVCVCVFYFQSFLIPYECAAPVTTTTYSVGAQLSYSLLGQVRMRCHTLQRRVRAVHVYPHVLLFRASCACMYVCDVL